jgi:hypothetical protein
VTPQDKLESLRAKLVEHARLTQKLAGALEVFERELLQLKRENALLKGENAALRKRVLVVEANVDHWLDLPIEQHPGTCECPDCFDARIQY